MQVTENILDPQYRKRSPRDIMHMLKTGCQRRMLPKDLAPCWHRPWNQRQQEDQRAQGTSLWSASFFCTQAPLRRQPASVSGIRYRSAGCAVVTRWLGGWVAGIRYRRGPPMVRNMRAVLKKASWGTRRVFRGIRCKKQASTVRKRYSVPKTAFSGTRRISKGPQNSTCRTECIFKGPQNSRLHRLWTASCRTGRIFNARKGRTQK